MNDKIEISSADIRHKEFASNMFGYKKSEVKEYLEMLSIQFEDLYAQRMNAGDTDQLNVYEDRTQTQLALEQIQKREELIAKTMLQAENTRNEIIKTAQKEADNIIKEAELAAKKAIDDTKHYLNVLNHEYVNLKESRRQFLSSAHAQLKTVLERLEQDPLFTRQKEADLDKEFEEAKKITVESKEKNVPQNN
ncbi:MAG: DivIVA domain-containing protein [Candidatus Cloacimonetes bacterium]|nr:DivIVA domain-containing protein [Candidatus Cloacimonadota bacterium]